MRFSTVNYESENPTVSARELHEKLHNKTPFKKWIDRMCEYGFEEFKDFWTKMSESTGGRPSTEYDLSIDMAKQIFARALKMADKTIESLKKDNAVLME